eukprot:12384916-Alexandrium_andersonii.AAC.1
MVPTNPTCWSSAVLEALLIPAMVLEVAARLHESEARTPGGVELLVRVPPPSPTPKLDEGVLEGAEGGHVPKAAAGSSR